ncbi:MAG: ORC-CDC6 family AAA ATPase [Luteolibacter sp.]
MSDDPNSWSKAFNARNLRPTEVAKTFVPNTAYERIQSTSHSVLIGPRGSGKTTLFKMLTLEGLQAWGDPLAKSTEEKLPFVAIYIPADVHWDDQLCFGDERLQRLPSFQQLLASTAVTTNVLASCCKAIRSYLQYNNKSCPEIENRVAKSMISEWKLPSTIPSIDAIEYAISSRFSEIKALSMRVAQTCESENQIPDLPDYFYLDYLFAMTPVLVAFDHALENPQPLKWALCFDELELTPKWLQDRLFAELRSTDQRFIFKLSASPVLRISSNTGAMSGQDYESIRLWAGTGAEMGRFSEKLTRRILRNRLGEEVDPFFLFGRSPNSRESSDYERGSSVWEAFSALAKWDKSFRSVLEKNGVDPKNPFTDDVSMRDRLFRKAKPIVLHRLEFAKIDPHGKLIARGRKKVALYCGADAIFDISEGNPRWLIGILNGLLTKVRRDEDGTLMPLEKSSQADTLYGVSRKFHSLLASVPEAYCQYNDKRIHLVDLIDKIGQYFFERIALDPFTVDPPGSVIVDNNVPEEIIRLLEIGLYQGALIHVNTDSDVGQGSIKGMRIKLAYLLSPIKKLPLRTYDAVNISSVLSQKRNCSDDGQSILNLD